MIVSKEFKWEAAHRIQWHTGKCKGLHGHSYRMEVEFEGEPDPNGFVIDFGRIKEIIEPYVNMVDHRTIISKNDMELKRTFDDNSWEYYLLPFDSTAENLCTHFLDIIVRNKKLLEGNRITKVGVKIYETTTAYAKQVVSL